MKNFGKQMDRDGGPVAKKPSKEVMGKDSEKSDAGFYGKQCSKMKKGLFRG